MSTRKIALVTGAGSDAVTCFHVNQQTGALTFTGQYTPVVTPAMILFLR
jgi:6-phosphogluconolactonase (cycloisomerase 2 family)